jgi:hypothetical protein
LIKLRAFCRTLANVLSDNISSAFASGVFSELTTKSRYNSLVGEVTVKAPILVP